MAIKFLSTVQVDTDVLYVDTANDRVGIGTASPGSKLEVSSGAGANGDSILTISADTDNSTSSSSPKLLMLQKGSTKTFVMEMDSSNRTSFSNIDGYYFSGGNVGIGTTSPTQKLHVGGGARIEGASTVNGSLTVQNGQPFYLTGSTYLTLQHNGVGGSIVNSTGDLVITNAAGNKDIIFKSSASLNPVEIMRIDGSSGRVGIGVTGPSALFEVNAADGVMVDTFMAYFKNSEATAGDNFGLKVDAGTNTSDVSMQINNSSGSALMRVRGDGNVGIGTTSPADRLHVNGTVRSQAPTTSDWGFLGYNSVGNAPSGLWFDNGDGELLLRDDSGNLNVRLRSDTSSYINGGNLGIGTTAPDAKLTVFRTDSTYAISRSNVETRAGLSVKSSSTYDSKLNFATGLNSQQYIQGLNNAATTGRPIVLNPYGGYVGINTANAPTQQLDIISGTNNGIRISATDSQTWRDIGIRSYVSEAEANALSDHTFIYTTNPSSGTEDPFGKFGATVIQGRDNGNSGFAIRLGNGGGHDTRMWMGGTGATTFSNTVTATNFILSSDERLKENIEEVCDNRVKADWKTFELKTDKGQKRYGVIAQELEKTNPEFVREDSQGFKSVAYIDLLIAKIAELEARLEKLEK